MCEPLKMNKKQTTQTAFEGAKMLDLQHKNFTVAVRIKETIFFFFFKGNHF